MDYMSLFLLLSLFLPSIVSEPISQSDAKSIIITSWKRGTQLIVPAEIEVTINRQNLGFQASFQSIDKITTYDLLINHSPVSDQGPYYESWGVFLFENSPLYPKSKRKPSYNLLRTSVGSPGGDFFPKEDNIGIIYPVEKPEYRIDGISAYPFLAKRIIKIEEFYVAFQIKSYKRSSNSPREIEALTLKIVLSNDLESIVCKCN